MKTKITCLMTALCAAFAAVPVSAAVPSSITECVPGTMNYQGYLANPSTGNAYTDGIYDLECRIYNAASGGTCLWGGKYSVYVKDGYFNIMLGSSNGQTLTTTPTPTYSNTDLWKALWMDGSSGTSLYLGVKPLQNYNHATLSSPTEITPRHQLLTSPFAFRAQRATYADQAQSNFTVPGSLTVNGTVNATSSSTQRFGPIQTTSTAVKLGGATTASTSLPSIYDVGSYLYFYSYYAMNFQTTSGDITFTPSASKNFKVTGSGNFLVDTPKTTIGGTSTTDIKGSTVTLKSGTSQLYVNSSSTVGNNTLKWTGKVSGSVKAPFIMKEITLTFASGTRWATSDIESTSSDYKWMIVGINNNNVTYAVSKWLAYEYDGISRIRLDLVAAPSSSITITVNCLGINKKFFDN